MSFKEKSLLLFDFDGTLIDSVPDLTYALNHMLQVHHLPEVDLKMVRPWVGNGAAILVKRAICRSFDYEGKVDDELAARLLTTFLTCYKENLYGNTIIYDGVMQGLAELSSKGYTMAIVTNKPFAFVEPILTALQMKEYFSFWIGGDSLEKKKPDALPLQHTLQHFQMTNEDAIMIGDTTNDILAAKAVPMQSIGVSYGYNEKEILESCQPDVICSHFKEVCELF